MVGHKLDDHKAQHTSSPNMATEQPQEKTSDTNGANMSLEEREEWLRQRGVQIENPSDRAAATSGSSSNGPTIIDQIAGLPTGPSQTNQIQDQVQGECGSVQFVFIPCDDSKEMATLRLPAAVANKPGDSMPEYLKEYFADSKSIDASLLQQQATKHFAGGHLQGLAKSNISASALNSVAAQGSVETFPLVHPAESNGHRGVYVYLDEVGMLKKSPANARASQIAAACGYDPPPSFYGDVFVGRVMKKEEAISNVDFVAGIDTDRGSSSWMRRAVQENVARQEEMNKLTGRMGETQPAQVGTEGKAAHEGSFEWTQDEDEIELSVPFEKAVDKKKISVSFLPRAIKVTYDKEEKLNIASLYGGVDVDGCTWTIDGKNLVITCEKSYSGEMWPRVMD